MNGTWRDTSIETVGRAGVLGALVAILLFPGYPLWLGLGALLSGRIDTLLSPFTPIVLALAAATLLTVPVAWLTDRWFGRRPATVVGVVVAAVYAVVFYVVVPDVFAI